MLKFNRGDFAGDHCAGTEQMLRYRGAEIQQFSRGGSEEVLVQRCRVAEVVKRLCRGGSEFRGGQRWFRDSSNSEVLQRCCRGGGSGSGSSGSGSG